MNGDALPVLLIDDEPLAREHVKRSVPWEQLCLRVVGEASDGQEALALLHDLKPAIAIVDINIPIFDGLTLAERAGVEIPECKILVLTGFGDFENARRALRAGVTEYVLKPLDKDELAHALARVRDVYLEEARQRSERERLYADSHSAAPSAPATQIQDALTNRTQPFDLPDLTGARILLFGIDRIEQRWPRIPEQVRWNQALQEIIRHSLASDRQTLGMGPDGLPFLVVREGDDYRRTITAVRVAVSQRFDFTVSVGVSDPVGPRVSLHDAYDHARDALEERFFVGYESTIDGPVEPRSEGVVVEDKSEILFALRTGEIQALTALVDRAIEMVHQRRLDRESVRHLTTEMAAAGAQFLAELDRSPREAVDEQHQRWLEASQRLDTLSEARTWVLEYFKQICEDASGHRSVRTFRVVDKAASYIREHFLDRDLTLKALADECSVNPTYLSKIFKAQTGKSVIEYLRFARLEHATRLMRESPSLRVHEIAEQSGFTDPLYFSKVFKATYGFSPRQYMRS